MEEAPVLKIPRASDQQAPHPRSERRPLLAGVRLGRFLGGGWLRRLLAFG
jgi:hypothetical protein